jgi:hypothetical protein
MRIACLGGCHDRHHRRLAYSCGLFCIVRATFASRFIGIRCYRAGWISRYNCRRRFIVIVSTDYTRDPRERLKTIVYA